MSQFKPVQYSWQIQSSPTTSPFTQGYSHPAPYQPSIQSMQSGRAKLPVQTKHSGQKKFPTQLMHLGPVHSLVQCVHTPAHPGPSQVNALKSASQPMQTSVFYESQLKQMSGADSSQVRHAKKQGVSQLVPVHPLSHMQTSSTKTPLEHTRQTSLTTKP